MTTNGIDSLATYGPAFWALETGAWFPISMRYYILERRNWKLHCWLVSVDLSNNRIADGP